MTKKLAVTALIAYFAVGILPVVADEPLVVYSERKEQLIKPMFERYTAATGVEIEYLTDSAGVLIERLAAEGERTPADLLITVDAGNLWLAAERGVLRAITSPTLEANVPDYLQDPDNQWFGLSQRARTIVYSTERVDPATLSTYEQLTAAQWSDRLCLRTSKKVYNQSLVATMIERFGADETAAVIAGWVENLAQPVYANDTSLLQAIAAGQCDVGISNTYYLGRILAEDEDFPVTVFWPNQGAGEGGVHVNISGAGVTKHSDQAVAAQALIEWLATEGQQKFAESNLEYPVKPGTALHPVVASWGEFEPDRTSLKVAGERQREATMLMDRAGYR